MADRASLDDQPGGQTAQESFIARAPSLQRPKGAGAIRGIGEKSGANPVTGTGSMLVPMSTGRDARVSDPTSPYPTTLGRAPDHSGSAGISPCRRSPEKPTRVYVGIRE